MPPARQLLLSRVWGCIPCTSPPVCACTRIPGRSSGMGWTGRVEAGCPARCPHRYRAAVHQSRAPGEEAGLRARACAPPRAPGRGGGGHKRRRAGPVRAGLTLWGGTGGAGGLCAGFSPFPPPPRAERGPRCRGGGGFEPALRRLLRAPAQLLAARRRGLLLFAGCAASSPPAPVSCRPLALPFAGSAAGHRLPPLHFPPPPRTLREEEEEDGSAGVRLGLQASGDGPVPPGLAVGECPLGAGSGGTAAGRARSRC